MRWQGVSAWLAPSGAALCLVLAALSQGGWSEAGGWGGEAEGSLELEGIRGAGMSGRVLGLRAAPRRADGFFGEDRSMFGGVGERGRGAMKKRVAAGVVVGGGSTVSTVGGEGDKDDVASVDNEDASPPPTDADEFGMEPEEASAGGGQPGEGGAGKHGDGAESQGTKVGVKGAVSDEDDEGEKIFEEPVWGETPPPGRSTEFLRGLVREVENVETMPDQSAEKLKMSEKTVKAADQQLVVAKKMRMDAAQEEDEVTELQQHLGEMPGCQSYAANWISSTPPNSHEFSLCCSLSHPQLTQKLNLPHASLC